MRLHPDLLKLRVVAIGCWIFGGWWIIQWGSLASLDLGAAPALLIFQAVASIILIGLGIAFWMLGTDQRAGVVFDSKGMMLNMGHYAAFVGWDNIDSLGKSHHRSSLLTLGSRRQLGILLHDQEAFIQSYEERLPAAKGPLARALRLLDTALRPLRRESDRASLEQLRRMRMRTGYDIQIPETFLGQSVEAFLATTQRYTAKRQATAV